MLLGPMASLMHNPCFLCVSGLVAVVHHQVSEFQLRIFTDTFTHLPLGHQHGAFLPGIRDLKWIWKKNLRNLRNSAGYPSKIASEYQKLSGSVDLGEHFKETAWCLGTSSPEIGG
jgi:hypothetical protein